ncbi:MAG: hypothetical protein ACOYMN_02005 [Roseimicrobium sp.]
MKTNSRPYLWILIVCGTAALGLQAFTWYRGRAWLRSDLAVPSFEQSACVSILLDTRDLAKQSRIHESLLKTDIVAFFGAEIESKAYTDTFFGLGYVKISAPRDHIPAILATAQEHLRRVYPDAAPKWSTHTKTYSVE